MWPFFLAWLAALAGGCAGLGPEGLRPGSAGPLWPWVLSLAPSQLHLSLAWEQGWPGGHCGTASCCPKERRGWLCQESFPSQAIRGRWWLYGHRCHGGAEPFPTQHLLQDPHSSLIDMQTWISLTRSWTLVKITLWPSLWSLQWIQISSGLFFFGQPNRSPTAKQTLLSSWNAALSSCSVKNHTREDH